MLLMEPFGAAPVDVYLFFIRAGLAPWHSDSCLFGSGYLTPSKAPERTLAEILINFSRMDAQCDGLATLASYSESLDWQYDG
jgi:hypothetical protein